VTSSAYPDILQELQAIHAGHANVGDNQLRTAAGKDFDPFPALSRSYDVESA